jgi:hypothetical protein
MKIEQICSPLYGEIGEQTCQLKQNATWLYVYPLYIYGAYDFLCSRNRYVPIIKAATGPIHIRV